MTTEFSPSAGTPEDAPAQTGAGASKIIYGDHANSGAPYAEPGTEGATAVKLMTVLGAWSKHEVNPDPPTDG